MLGQGVQWNTSNKKIDIHTRWNLCLETQFSRNCLEAMNFPKVQEKRWLPSKTINKIDKCRGPTPVGGPTTIVPGGPREARFSPQEIFFHNHCRPPHQRTMWTIKKMFVPVFCQCCYRTWEIQRCQSTRSCQERHGPMKKFLVCNGWLPFPKAHGSAK